MAIANAPDLLQCEPFSYNTVTQPTNIWCSPGEAGLWQTCTDSHKVPELHTGSECEEKKINLFGYFYDIGNDEDQKDLFNQLPVTTDPIPKTVPHDINDDDEPLTQTCTRPPSDFRSRQSGCPRLYEVLIGLLNSKTYNPSHIKWVDRLKGEFKIVRSSDLARMWGEIKNNDGMTYGKMSRAMRYYYKREILDPVKNRRLVYKFGPKTREWLTNNNNVKN